jgi:hypothetical protein
MFFDGRRFPNECDAGWAPVSSLETFHPDNTNIFHRKSVAKFLVDRDSRLTSSSCVVSGQCIVIPDDDDCNDGENESSVRQADHYLVFVGDKPIEDNSDVTNGNPHRDIIRLRHLGVQRYSQMEQNSRTGGEKGNKNPEVNYNYVFLEDFNLRRGAAPGSQTDSHTQEILDEGSKPSLPPLPNLKRHIYRMLNAFRIYLRFMIL